MARYDKEDLWIFTLNKERARFKDYEKYCMNGRFQEGFASNLNKQKMNQYLKELRNEKKIARGYDEANNFKYYYVPEEKIDEVKALIERRQIAKGIEHLSKNEREDFFKKLKQNENKTILNLLALKGPMLVSVIAEKTGFTETKILEALGGPLSILGLLTTDKKYWLPAKEREYGLSLCGFYRALREDITHFDIIVQKWGCLHPFIFSRLDQLIAYGLDVPMKEFLRKVKPDYHIEGEEKTRKQIEQYLVAFIVSGYNHRYIMDWLKFLHADKQFRERIEGFFKEIIDGYKLNITAFEMVLGIIGKLGRRSNPNWDEMEWNIGSIHGLEGFIHFPWMLD